jgi:phosphatidylserine decarboxylase
MIAKGAWHWIITPLILSVLVFVLSINHFSLILYFLAFLLILIFFTFLIFFRDPCREIGEGITAPADGIVKRIEKNDESIMISTFMRIHDVHVNRCPIDGKVVGLKHVLGKHIPAYKENYEKNEKVIIDLDTKIGKVRIVQIAGIFARRIVPYVKDGEELKKGQRIGIVRFGSRVDLHLPLDDIRLKIKEETRIYAGTTQIAEVERVE